MRCDISISCIKMPSIACYDQKIIPQLQALKTYRFYYKIYIYPWKAGWAMLEGNVKAINFAL